MEASGNQGLAAHLEVTAGLHRAVTALWQGVQDVVGASSSTSRSSTSTTAGTGLPRAAVESIPGVGQFSSVSTAEVARMLQDQALLRLPTNLENLPLQARAESLSVDIGRVTAASKFLVDAAMFAVSTTPSHKILQYVAEIGSNAEPSPDPRATLEVPRNPSQQQIQTELQTKTKTNTQAQTQEQMQAQGQTELSPLEHPKRQEQPSGVTGGHNGHARRLDDGALPSDDATSASSRPRESKLSTKAAAEECDDLELPGDVRPRDEDDQVTLTFGSGHADAPVSTRVPAQERSPHEDDGSPRETRGGSLPADALDAAPSSSPRSSSQQLPGSSPGGEATKSEHADRQRHPRDDEAGEEHSGGEVEEAARKQARDMQVSFLWKKGQSRSVPLVAQ